MRNIILVVLTLLLVSCEGLGTLPDLGLNTQSSSSASTNYGNGTGRDARVGLAFSAGDNRSKQFNDSNIRSQDTDNNVDTSMNTTKLSIGGEHIDNSLRTTHTRSGTKDSHYVGETVHVLHGESIWEDWADNAWILGALLLGFFLSRFIKD